jgi:dTDP-4-amino-4,6-dideoxygalactose transaminase
MIVSVVSGTTACRNQPHYGKEKAMIKVPFLDLKAQYRSIRDEVLPALEAVCESTGFAQGPATKVFEEEFAAYCGVKYCVTLNSGTSALHVAMLCLGIGPGDEVIVPAMTFIATAWGVSYVGAKPVFVDIDPQRRTLDPRLLEAAITKRTKAIIPVDLYGLPAELDAIQKIADKYGIAVVQDSAQSQGSRYKGRSIGNYGKVACTSFYPGKNLGAYGEGGALLTNDAKIAEHARCLRDHGQKQRYHHDEVGYNYRMDGFQGAVLGIKLRHLDAWNAARKAHAQRYNELLAGLPLTLPDTPPDSVSSWHLYVIEHDNRDALREKLTAGGVDTGLHYPVPLHLQKVYEGLGYHRGDFPVTEKLADRCLSLPMFAELTDGQVHAVAASIRSAV